MMHRFLRLSAFLAGLLVGGLSVLFAFDNPARISLAVANWQFQGIPLWTVALAPLVVGLAAGYLYHLPARLHHFNEHMRHRGLVHDLKKENQELSRSLDRLLAMPNDDTPAIAAAAAARDITPVAAVAPTAALAETVVIAAAPVAQPAGNGHGGRRSERRTTARSEARPQAMKEAIAAAAAAMPVERQGRTPRPGRTPKAPTPTTDAG